MALQVFTALLPHILEAPPGTRPHEPRNSSTCIIGFQLRAPAGPISDSTPPSSGCKSLQGMPFGLSGSARGSFLGSVVERTGSGEQERQLKLLLLALSPHSPPLRTSSSSQAGAAKQKHLFFKYFHTFPLYDHVPDLAIRNRSSSASFLLTSFTSRRPFVSVSSVILLLPHPT